jgi:anti-sigma factor RsiW
MTWHVEPTTLSAYLDGRLTEAEASSVEAHLLRCTHCRDELARSSGAVMQSVHDATWQTLADAVDMPSTGSAGRLAGRFLPAHVVRLLTVTSAMQSAWWTSGTAVLVFALLASHLGTGTVGTALFVVSAPLVPLAGVALAYAQRTDVAGELAVTTPYPRFRLLLLRTLAVATVTLPVVAVLAAALPVDARLAALWVAPSLALCALSLMLSSAVDARWAAGALGIIWLVASWSTLRPSTTPQRIDAVLLRSIAFRPVGQAVLLAVALGALLVAIARRARLEEGIRA